MRSVSSFKPRTSQCEMAQRVEQTLLHGGVLVAESGTGTGKTFAYLTPVVLNGCQVIISTATRHLQDQIFHRDLPLVCQTLERAVDAFMLKGRSNYLCLLRLRQAGQQEDWTYLESSDNLAKLQYWAQATTTGDIAQAEGIKEDASIWRHVTSSVDNCLASNCPDYNDCYVFKARKKALQADVLVVNHHLFFSDFALKTEGFGELLPDYQAVIFDEAHNITDIATRFFGYSVSTFQLNDLCRDILAAEKLEQSRVELNPQLEQLKRQISLFNRHFKSKSERITQQQAQSNHSVTKSLAKIDTALEVLRQSLEAAAVAGEQLNRCHQRCLSIQSHLQLWQEDHDSNMVHWLAANGSNIHLHGSPLKVDRYFSSLFKQAERAWIFTSATLAVESRFDLFCTELGLTDVDTVQWRSPYDFEHNTLLYLPQQLPDPREIEYPQALAQVILTALQASRGRAFCLFTSYRMMSKVYALTIDHSPWPMMIQGESSRSELLHRFVNTPHAVLFGTNSFWQGVDVCGEALSCVIIDKLPFASPSDPVLKGRMKALESAGINPFYDYQLPAAVIALRQGAGRLIRSETDRGVLIIADTRLTHKSYGHVFLNSLPAMPVTQSVHDVEAFFNTPD